MTTPLYADLEGSVQDGKPVECYRFRIDRTGGQGAGDGGGGLIVQRTLEPWAYTQGDISSLLAKWPFDAVNAGGSSSYGSGGTFAITTFWSGPLGGGGGHVYHYRTFGAADGLGVGEIGELTVLLALSRNPSPFACGVAI